MGDEEMHEDGEAPTKMEDFPDDLNVHTTDAGGEVAMSLEETNRRATATPRRPSPRRRSSRDDDDDDERRPLTDPLPPPPPPPPPERRRGPGKPGLGNARAGKGAVAKWGPAGGGHSGW